jgi:hypothetical protein
MTAPNWIFLKLYGPFHNVVRDYKRLEQENQRTYLIGIFHSHKKTERAFLWQLEMSDVRTTGDTAHIDTIFKFLPHTPVHMGASIFFTTAMIRTFRSARSRGQFLCVLSTKCKLHFNHRITHVIFQHTKRLLPRSGHFPTTYTRIA